MASPALVAEATTYLTSKSHPASIHQFAPNDIPAIQHALLDWFCKHARPMPWRVPPRPHGVKAESGSDDATTDDPAQNSTLPVMPDPYKVWVSEIMLQQTQVDTVRPYFARWMSRFPTIAALAAASLDDVNAVWKGLGYYSRAARLHQCAQVVVREHAGALPADHAALLALPGVGPYTAGAVASIAFGMPVPLVDGNVIRVYTRMRALAADTSAKRATDAVWALAADLVSKDRPGDFNQALMDLGATICTPRNPACAQCPVNAFCRAYAEEKASKSLRSRKLFGSRIEETRCLKDENSPMDTTDSDPCDMCVPLADIEDAGPMRYPVKLKKTKQRDEDTIVAVVQHGDMYLISQRPKTGLLANLYEFPSVEAAPSDALADIDGALDTILAERYGVAVSPAAKRTSKGTVLHIFSHVRMTYHVAHIVLADIGDDEKLPSVTKGRWVSLEQLAREPLSTAMKKVFMTVLPDFDGGVEAHEEDAKTRKRKSNTAESAERADTTKRKSVPKSNGIRQQAGIMQFFGKKG